MKVLTADWFRRQTYPTPACICPHQRLTETTWELRLTSTRCPQHGKPPHRKATA